LASIRHDVFALVITDFQIIATQEFKLKIISFIMIFAGVAVAQVAQGAEILPGNWNVEMTLAMGDEKPVPAKDTTICLQNVKELVNAGAGCSVATTSENGDHVDMKISCNVSGLIMDGTGSLTAAQSTVDGTFNLAMQMGAGMSVKTVSTLHAVRIGDCK
jgi:hypothetical protein